ncbi:MAG: DNA gyrase inhibitor YacG [Thiobacillus sp.]
MKTLKVACPTCGTSVVWAADSRWKPFCSQRCKLIDLGQWAEENYRIPVAPQTDDDTLPPDETGRAQ